MNTDKIQLSHTEAGYFIGIAQGGVAEARAPRLILDGAKL